MERWDWDTWGLVWNNLSKQMNRPVRLAGARAEVFVGESEETDAGLVRDSRAAKRPPRLKRAAAERRNSKQKRAFVYLNR
jgi:hypothetical protein